MQLKDGLNSSLPSFQLNNVGLFSVYSAKFSSTLQEQLLLFRCLLPTVQVKRIPVPIPACGQFLSLGGNSGLSWLTEAGPCILQTVSFQLLFAAAVHSLDDAGYSVVGIVLARSYSSACESHPWGYHAPYDDHAGEYPLMVLHPAWKSLPSFRRPASTPNYLRSPTRRLSMSGSGPAWPSSSVRCSSSPGSLTSLREHSTSVSGTDPLRLYAVRNMYIRSSD